MAKFQVGLVMAGGASAGAYTAGVVDFFIEALEAWHAEKAKNLNSIPNHDVSIKAISGASAGAMTAAMLARVFVTGAKPQSQMQVPQRVAEDPRDQKEAFENPFYAAWVQSIDVRFFLEGRDLAIKKANVVSVLDSTVLSYIGRNVLQVPPGSVRSKPPYVDGSVEIFITTTNLRGVPYSFGFAGLTANYKYIMRTYADYRRFCLSWTGDCPGEEPHVYLDPDALAPSSNWAVMMESALASGAFPGGFAPRKLSRMATDFDHRRWKVASASPLTTLSIKSGKTKDDDLTELAIQQNVVCAQSDAEALLCNCASMEEIAPCWPDGIGTKVEGAVGADPTYEYEYWNVDGGVMNNEPLELVRRALSGEGRNPRGGLEADRAVVMIDPFPNAENISAEFENDFTLIGALKALIGALITQSRFKPEELVLAERRDVFSRFAISPIYINESKKIAEPALAGSVVGGFGGFLSETFRHHDFQLGRRNCQQFLRRHFVLPIGNPLFSDSRNRADFRGKFIFERDGEEFAPIIPLVGSVATEITLPSRPHPADINFEILRELLGKRVDLVVPRLIDSISMLGIRYLVKALWTGAWIIGQRGKLVEAMIKYVGDEVSVLRNR
tara:strand:- start:3067 stop:4905 length:1839 start_codon:yes stop_codon:yes gene_type:complete